jgi:hypothetical protein
VARKPDPTSGPKNATGSTVPPEKPARWSARTLLLKRIAELRAGGATTAQAALSLGCSLRHVQRLISILEPNTGDERRAAGGARGRASPQRLRGTTNRA